MQAQLVEGVAQHRAGGIRAVAAADRVGAEDDRESRDPCRQAPSPQRRVADEAPLLVVDAEARAARGVVAAPRLEHLPHGCHGPVLHTALLQHRGVVAAPPIHERVEIGIRRRPQADAFAAQEVGAVGECGGGVVEVVHPSTVAGRRERPRRERPQANICRSATRSPASRARAITSASLTEGKRPARSSRKISRIASRSSLWAATLIASMAR